MLGENSGGKTELLDHKAKAWQYISMQFCKL